MSDQTSAIPPIPSTAEKPKRKWRWWQTVLVIVFGGYFVLKLLSSYNPVNLELTRRNLIDRAQDGQVVEMLNVGSKTITITKVTFNDRADCDSRSGFEPFTLKVGDSKMLSVSKLIEITPLLRSINQTPLYVLFGFRFLQNALFLHVEFFLPSTIRTRLRKGTTVCDHYSSLAIMRGYFRFAFHRGTYLGS